MLRTVPAVFLCLPVLLGAAADKATPPHRSAPRPSFERAPAGVTAWESEALTEVAAAVAEDPLRAEVNECHSEVHADPPESGAMDVERYVLQFDCDAGILTVGVRTTHPFEDADLGDLFVFFDTDLDASTGYQGYDHTLMVFHEDGALGGGVFRSPTSEIEQDWELTTVAQIDRADEADFIGVVFPHAGIGGAERFRWIAEMYGADEGAPADRVPDAGSHETTLTRPAGSPPVPEARGIDQACPPARVPDAGFPDVSASTTHAAAIDCVAWWGVAEGIGDSSYAPAVPVTRAQMATFLVRLLTSSGGTLPDSAPDAFSDDDASVHEANINRLAAADIAEGGGENGRFRPASPVTRAQMATFLVRAYEYRTVTPLPAPANYFTDDDGSEAHAANIDKAAAAGFTGGRPDGSYGPAGAVRRDQMASFMSRVLDLLVEDEFAQTP